MQTLVCTRCSWRWFNRAKGNVLCLFASLSILFAVELFVSLSSNISNDNCVSPGAGILKPRSLAIFKINISDFAQYFPMLMITRIFSIDQLCWANFWLKYLNNLMWRIYIYIYNNYAIYTIIHLYNYFRLFKSAPTRVESNWPCLYFWVSFIVLIPPGENPRIWRKFFVSVLCFSFNVNFVLSTFINYI